MRFFKTLLFWSVSVLTVASASPRVPAGDVVSVLGQVFIREDREVDTNAMGKMRQARAGDPIYAGDVINTASNAGVKIMLRDRSILDLGPSSLFKVSEFKQGKNSERQVELDMTYGSVRAAVTEKLKGQSKFKLRTPSAVMGVRGTVAISEVSLGDQAATGPARGGASESKTTFLITQGQGEVTAVGGGAQGASAVVLNPGDQASTSSLSFGSSGASGSVNKESLSPAQLDQKTQQAQNLSRSTDTAFVLATNFDRAREQNQQERTQEQRSGASNASAGRVSQDPGERSPATASAGAGPGPAGSILTSMTTQLAQSLPPPGLMTISNLGVSGAPTNLQVLSQQSNVISLPPAATKSLTVKVSW